MDVRLRTGLAEDVITSYKLNTLDLDYGGNFDGEVTIYYANKLEKVLRKWDVIKVITAEDLKTIAVGLGYSSLKYNKQGYYKFTITKKGKGSFNGKIFNA